MISALSQDGTRSQLEPRYTNDIIPSTEGQNTEKWRGDYVGPEVSDEQLLEAIEGMAKMELVVEGMDKMELVRKRIAELELEKEKMINKRVKIESGEGVPSSSSSCASALSSISRAFQPAVYPAPIYQPAPALSSSDVAAALEARIRADHFANLSTLNPAPNPNFIPPRQNTARAYETAAKKKWEEIEELMTADRIALWRAVSTLCKNRENYPMMLSDYQRLKRGPIHKSR